MKSLAIMSTYNEQQFLPLKIQWCKANGFDLYVCDNMSTDDTVKILQDNSVPFHQYDTKGIFSELRMQNEIYDTLCRLNPDWVLYMGCDLFFNFHVRLINYNYNCYSFQFYSMKYTGELRRELFNPFDNFRYGMKHDRLKFYFKWNKDIQFRGDEIIIPNESCFDSVNLAVNYGDTKTQAERMETLHRRQKAWNMGECNGWGEHLRHGNSKNWQWDKRDLIDFKDTSIWPYIQQIKIDAGL